MIEFKGFTTDELKRAFDGVKNPGNWKLPIDAVITEKEIPVVLTAIEFFTGSKARITKVGEDRFRVVADGYYRAVGP